MAIGLAHRSEREENRIACANPADEGKKRNKMLAVAALLISALMAFYPAIRGRA